MRYEIQPTTDDSAKFPANRPTHLGDPVAKK